MDMIIKNGTVVTDSETVSYTHLDVYKRQEYFSTLNGVLFNKDKSELICYPAGRKVSTNYEIPGVVKHIGIGAFYNCSVLENVVIPTSVDSIGDLSLIHIFVILNKRKNRHENYSGKYTVIAKCTHCFKTLA